MRWTVVLEQEADGGFVATVPALPGCVSQGDSRDEAIANVGRLEREHAHRSTIAGHELHFKLRTVAPHIHNCANIAGLQPVIWKAVDEHDDFMFFRCHVSTSFPG